MEKFKKIISKSEWLIYLDGKPLKLENVEFEFYYDWKEDLSKFTLKIEREKKKNGKSKKIRGAKTP